MKKISICFLIALFFFALSAVDANAAPYDQIIQRWTKQRIHKGEDRLTSLEIKATYYSAEFIEATLQKEAQKNLWTQQEADDYKYSYLKALQLDEMIPIFIEFNNNAETMYIGPFDIFVSLKIGNKTYKPVDYDKRFNFKFQGKKEGLVYFRRYDKDTGKDLLKGVKNVKLELKSTINPTVTNGRDTTFLWDVANDDPSKLYQGKAADRFETDRLLKRLDKLRKDKAGLEAQIKTVNDEIGTIQSRLDELAKK